MTAVLGPQAKNWKSSKVYIQTEVVHARFCTYFVHSLVNILCPSSMVLSKLRSGSYLAWLRHSDFSNCLHQA